MAAVARDLRYLTMPGMAMPARLPIASSAHWSRALSWSIKFCDWWGADECSTVPSLSQESLLTGNCSLRPCACCGALQTTALHELGAWLEADHFAHVKLSCSKTWRWTALAVDRASHDGDGAFPLAATAVPREGSAARAAHERERCEDV